MVRADGKYAGIITRQPRSRLRVRLRTERTGNPFGMGIKVHGLAAEKADEGLAALTGEFDGEAGWGGNGGDDGNPRGQCLLHNLERSSPADEQDVRVEGKPVFQKRIAEDLIDSIVPANIFAQDDKFALRIKNRSGVQAAGLREGRLGSAQAFGELGQRFG